jgi:hypothetical protein
MSRPRLAVVTHTNRKQPQYMEQMLESLGPGLPDYAEHFIIECFDPKEYERMRWESRLLGEYVCFVDDDDLIVNDGIRRCMAEFDKDPELGIVFTSQELIDEQGNHLEDFPELKPEVPISYRDLAITVQAIHHLAIFRSDAVDPRCFHVAQALNCTGVEWLMKVTAAFGHHAVHVPIYGYQWRQRQSSISKSSDWIKGYNDQITQLRSFLLCHVYPEGNIPRATT